MEGDHKRPLMQTSLSLPIFDLLPRVLNEGRINNGERRIIVKRPCSVAKGLGNGY